MRQVSGRDWIFILASIFWQLNALAAEPDDLVFDRMTTRDGLSISAIDALAQGPQGFMWIATQDGLNRFDGYEFRVFRNDPSRPDSLPDNFVRALHLGSNGNLWVGTADGLAKYQPATETFARIELPATSRYVEDIHSDAFGRLWVATLNGLWRIDPATGEKHRFTPENSGLADAQVRSVLIDGEGVAWAGTAQGIQMYSSQDNRFMPPPVADWPEALAGTRVNDIFEDNRAHLWIATRDEGLFLLAPDRRTVFNWRHDPADATSLPENEVLAVTQDRDGKIWVGTWGGGLSRLVSLREGFEHFQYDPANPDSIAGNLVRSLHVDRAGNLWIGTHNLGLSRLNRARSRFGRIGTNPGSEVSLGSPGVYSILMDRDARLWVGTVAGLDRFAADRDSVTRFNPENRRLAAKFVLALLQDSSGRIWAGTREGGLCLFAPDADRFDCLDDSPGLAALGEVGVSVLHEASDGDLWVGTNNAGLRRFDPETGRLDTWRHDPRDPTSLSHDRISGIHEDASGRLWVLTFGGGLNRLLADGSGFEHWPHIADDADTMTANRLAGIAEAGDGSLWIGSVAGLNHFDPETGNVTRWTRDDGLPNETVYSVLLDGNGDVWVSTNRGIARLDVATGEFTAFTSEDGLLDDEYNAFAAFRDGEGRLYFGGTDGVTYFHPDEILLPAKPPKVLLTRLLLGDREAVIGASDDAPLQQSMTMARRIALDHEQSAFSIEFTALEYLQPGSVRFQYRLRGFDETWLETGPARRIATYTNLEPGEYGFQVRAATGAGEWSEPANLVVTLTPVPWLSAPALALYVLLALLLLGYLLRQHWQRLRLLRAHARDLAGSEQRLQLALWGSGDWLWDWNIVTGDVYCAELAQALGFEPKEKRSLERVYQLIHPEDVEKVQRHIEAELVEPRGMEMSFRVLERGGGYRWLQWRGKVVARDESGKPVRMTGTCKDITRQREADIELKLAARVLDNSNDAVAIIDLDFNFIKVNPAFTRVTGYAPEEVIGKSSSILDSGRYSKDFSNHVREAVHQRGEWQGEIWERRKNGDLYLSDLHLSTVTDENGKRTHIVAVFSDVTRRRKFEEELRYLANYDILTGLPNRTLFIERLSHSVTKARRHESTLAVFFIDLDNFKQVNDSLGHAIGDMLLKQVSARLGHVFREDDTVARLGGDEFTVIVEDIDGEAEAAELASCLLEEFAVPVELDGHELNVTPSIGIAMFPRDGQGGEALIKNADTAMYAAKERGRNAFVFYDESMGDSALGRLQLENLLRKAIERNELVVHYQPKVNLESGRISGVEALVRWNSEERGLVMPDEFIAVAEERGMIREIGEWVLRRACADIALLDESGNAGLPIAVNLSARQTMEPQLVDTVTAALDDAGIESHRLQLELTESLIMENAGETIKVLEALRDRGVQLVVDDFGTGYSSLSYLKRLPVDQIKVDKSFVQDVLHDEFAVAIIRAIVAMARSLRLLVTAEGVEQQAQLELLRELGCTEVQGFLYAPPMPLDELKEFLAGKEFLDT